MNHFIEWMPIWFINLLLSVLVGGLIGLEQESYHKNKEQKHIGGIRTFSLISMLGFSTQYFIKNTTFLTAVFISFVCLITAEYIYEAIYYKRKGITTEIAGMLAFIAGIMLASGYAVEAFTVSIFITLILSVKQHLHEFIHKYIGEEDIIAVVKFLIVTVVLYSILPNKSYTSLLINPKSIWLMVVLISSISFVAYFTVKIFGTNKGIMVTAFLGGLISSTAVTLAFSKRSKEKPAISESLSYGIILASIIMFLRQLIIVLILYPRLSEHFAVFAISLFIVGVVIIVVGLGKKEKGVEVQFSNPYELSSALMFGFFYALVLVLSRIANNNFGSAGVYVLGFISGAADVDPITISMSQLSKHSSIPIDVALTTIMIASITNTVFKGILSSIFGTKKLYINVWKAFSILSAVGTIFILYIHFS